MKKDHNHSILYSTCLLILKTVLWQHNNRLPYRQQQPPSRPAPMERHVATGLVNLGNTCYMSAVLQALAHCQELNMAMDVVPHSATCPIAKSRKDRASPSPPLGGTRKSTRNGKKSPSPSAASYCALCEFEALHQQVHSMKEAVAPSTFVHGFIDHVAPWFKLGVQEDSHEFLRLLIDAMQKSCIHARSSSLQSAKTMNIPFNSFVEPSNPRSSASRARRVAPRLILLKTLDSMSRLTRVAVVVHLPMSVRPLPNSRRKKCWKDTSAKSAARRARLPNRLVWRPFHPFLLFISSDFVMERPLPKKVRHDVVAKFRNCSHEMWPPRKLESPVRPRLKVTSSLNNSLISCHL